MKNATSLDVKKIADIIYNKVSNFVEDTNAASQSKRYLRCLRDNAITTRIVSVEFVDGEHATFIIAQNRVIFNCDRIRSAIHYKHTKYVDSIDNIENLSKDELNEFIENSLAYITKKIEQIEQDMNDELDDE